MERIDIASEPDDGEVLEEIDRLIFRGRRNTVSSGGTEGGAAQTAVLQCAEARCPAGAAGRCGNYRNYGKRLSAYLRGTERQNREIRQKLYLRRKAGGCDSADCRPMQPRGE